MSDVRAISYEDAQALTPSDSVVFTKPYAAFMVTVAGNVQITTLRGRRAVLPVNANVVYTIPFSQLWSTSTTATGIIGLVALPYLGNA